IGVGEAAPDGVVPSLELQRFPELGGAGRLVAEAEVLDADGESQGVPLDRVIRHRHDLLLRSASLLPVLVPGLYDAAVGVDLQVEGPQLLAAAAVLGIGGPVGAPG